MTNSCICNFYYTALGFILNVGLVKSNHYSGNKSNINANYYTMYVAKSKVVIAENFSSCLNFKSFIL